MNKILIDILKAQLRADVLEKDRLSYEVDAAREQLKIMDAQYQEVCKRIGTGCEYLPLVGMYFADIDAIIRQAEAECKTRQMPTIAEPNVDMTLKEYAALLAFVEKGKNIANESLLHQRDYEKEAAHWEIALETLYP